MKTNRSHHTMTLATIAALLCTAPSWAVTTNYTGPNSNGRSDTWSVPANWDNAVPGGALDVVIPDNITVTVDAVPETYTGNLSIGANSTLRIEWLGADPLYYRALGTPGQTVITVGPGSLINCRAGGANIVPEIRMTGDFTYVMSQSTQPSGDPHFAHGIHGPHTFTLQGKGGCDALLTTANTFAELVADPKFGTNFRIDANAAGSLGGDVTILANASTGAISANLRINTADAMADTATLTLNGTSTTLLTLGADETIAKLVLNGVSQPTGTYGGTGSAAENKVSWISGGGILTVAGTSAPAYWDLNGATAGAGGSGPAGTWNAVNANWSASPDGDAFTAAWTPGQAAIFSAGADATGSYTVTVDGTRDIGGLGIEEGTVTLSGGELRATGDADLSVASGLIGTITGTLSDDGAPWVLSKVGDGTLVLTGANTYTGATGVAAGALSAATLADAGANSPLGSYPTAGPDGLLLSGGTLQYTGASASTNRGFTVGADSAIDLTMAGSALTVGDCAASGLPATLTITGGAGSSLATGEITLIKGTSLTVNPTTGPVTVGSVRGFTSYPNPAPTLTLGGATTGNTVTGSLFTQNPPGSPFAISMKLVKAGTGEWTLSGNNSHSGTTTVSEGTLILGGGSQASVITVQSGAKLGFVIGATVNSNKALALDAGHGVQVNGTPTDPSHVLMTASGGITGNPVLDPPIPGYVLEVVGNELQLNGGAVPDYDTWAMGFTGADLADPDADLDGDGLSNDTERLFGLDPTDPGSVHPITAPLDAAAGTLSFSRRDNALTGKFARIETSTDLVTWSEDTGALLVADPPDASGVETVNVTLSPGLLSAPTLFVRVVQDDGILFSEDFEAGNGGFTFVTAAGSDWEFGAPASGGLGGDVLAGNGGSTQCWGTDIGTPGEYLVPTTTRLRSPVIDLTSVTGARLSFAEAMDIAATDVALVHMIAEATDTVIAAGIYAATDADINAADWATVPAIDLAPGVGMKIRLEWAFTGGTPEYLGWYIDDVTISETAP